jgi:hypothetical protein
VQLPALSGEDGASPISLNAAINSLKFVFNITVSRPELMAKMQPVRIPRYATLSPVLLERLRTWWRVARAQGKMFLYGVPRQARRGVDRED